MNTNMNTNTNMNMNTNKIHGEDQQSMMAQKKAKRKSSMAQPAARFKQLAAQQFEQKAIVLCQFCGGATCKQEDYRTNKIQPNAIQGLHSNWITNHILAMQRPSDRLIKQYAIYDKFKREKINTILNLQEPGQHPDCGDGLLKNVGFSYDPEGFFNCGISFFNESWEDMTATTFDHMMRIMNIFYTSIVRDEGKIAVHCHAGRGRTLLVICSWLIYYDRWPAKTTINVAVERREGVLTRSSQRQFLEDFQQQLKQRWVSFGPIAGSTFAEFVSQQKMSLLKHEQKQSKFRPYVHWKIVQQFQNRIKRDQNISKDIMMALTNCHHLHFDKRWNQQHEQQLNNLKKFINEHTLFTKRHSALEKVDNRVLVELLYDFYDGLPFALFNAHATQFLIQHADKLKEGNKIDAIFQPEFVHQTGVEAISVMIDLILLVKGLTERNLLKKVKEDQQVLDGLIMRIGLLLTSKRKYCKKLFSEKDDRHRECKILKYDKEKLKKYTSETEVKFVDYLKCIMNQIGKQGKQYDEILNKVRKIQANIVFFSKKHTNEQQYIQKHQAREIYQKSREN